MDSVVRTDGIEERITRFFLAGSDKRCHWVYFNRAVRMLLGLSFSRLPVYVNENATVFDLLVKTQYDLGILHDTRFRLYGVCGKKATRFENWRSLRDYETQAPFQFQCIEESSIIELFGTKGRTFIDISVNNGKTVKSAVVVLKENYIFYDERKGCCFRRQKRKVIGPIMKFDVLFCGQDADGVASFEICCGGNVYRLSSTDHKRVADWYCLVRDSPKAPLIREIEGVVFDAKDGGRKRLGGATRDGMECTRMFSALQSHGLDDMERKYAEVSERMKELAEASGKGRSTAQKTKELSRCIFGILVQLVCINRRNYMKKIVFMLQEGYRFYTKAKKADDISEVVKGSRRVFFQKKCNLFFHLSMTYRSFLVNCVYYETNTEWSKEERVCEEIVSELHGEAGVQILSFSDAIYLQKRYLEEGGMSSGHTRRADKDEISLSGNIEGSAVQGRRHSKEFI
ncbi:MAG: uncharacterized protein A8A55_1609 [Amphiamblys sp. WSBS2006]|nr:MAG: uncharacterized protein A8A55_1609 [Amphiamblys sp. WSBS2006]